MATKKRKAASIEDAQISITEVLDTLRCTRKQFDAIIAKVCIKLVLCVRIGHIDDS